LEKTLIWNGKTAEQMGLKIISLPPIQVSTERIDEQDVEGRDGTLTFLNGYTSDEKEVEADYKGNKPVEVVNWLQGKGEVIFGNLPDRYYKARINNIVPLDEVIRNQLYNFPIKFKCQPFRYHIGGKKKIIITSTGTIINNPGTYKSLPLITVYGSGAGYLSINGITYTITNIGGSMVIDSNIQEVLYGKGDYLQTDEFIELPVGKCAINFSGGITKVEIIPYWRDK
jgi:phage-related protein